MNLKQIFLVICLVTVHVTSGSNGIIADGQGKRLLALLDSYSIRETHSSFFKSLRDRGFQITYKAADDSDLTLTKYNEYLYDHLILFCPNVVEFGGNISTKSIVDFIDDGGNVLVAANSQLSEPIKEIAGECGIEYGDEGTFVIDRFNSDLSDQGHNTLVVSDADNLINNNLIVGNSRKNGVPLLYRGVGLTSDPENPLLIDVLTASTTAYTYKPDEKIADYPHSVGKNTLLISALQARNNARVVFTGSLEFFSNEFFESSVQKYGSTKRFDKSGNEELSTSLTQWVFKERGVLRVGKVKHYQVGQQNQPNPNTYTIKDQIVYSIQIEEVVNGKWQPFQGQDVQLEFIRLDPFIRTTLKNQNGNLNVQFQVPDVYGIFKFNVEYHRLGYTNLFSTTQVSVRPLQHTEYDRFIPAAFPYYASAFSMMLAVFLFSFIQLYHQDSSPQTQTTQATSSK